MKKYFLYIFSLSFLFGLSQSEIPKTNDLNYNSSIFFTENKGQVSDQNYKPRMDVLFSGTDGQLSYHLKNNGISYQLNRVDSWKKEDTLIFGTEFHREKAMLVPDKSTMYRIDINWLNTNKNVFVKKQKALPGYNNYYLETCPNGALKVKSYEGLIYQQIYNGIDLKWYQKDGHLKYDYIVAAGADYKEIRLEINGAEKLSINKTGELIIKTPLGEIIEGAPIVYQNNIQLVSKWKMKNNILSFEIDNYDPKLLMIIDPNVCSRIWGTYYGAQQGERSQCTITDKTGNVYMAGYSESVSAIATSGAHQTSFGGYYDAFLAKFDQSGFRLWGTYYGGSGLDHALGCCVDSYNNVFITGDTFTGTGTVIATNGSFQSVHGDPNLSDAFLVKFDSTGVRHWGTFYGDSAHDVGYSCTTDKVGNIYLTGYAGSSNTPSSVFSTPGAFQPVIPPFTRTAFIAKFTNNGMRIWSTYFGPNGPSISTNGLFCALDKKNNVFITGLTQAPTSTFIASNGSHQSSYGGGMFDAFLVKFDSNGVRQWGTYYGGPGFDIGYACATDTSGNVYFSGETAGSNGTVIATPGSHQSLNAGGYDAFLVKFNTNGVRQWGTYYGGGLQEYGYGCCTNSNNDLFLAGSTESSSGISTPGTHQTVLSSTNTTKDGFVAKFDINGVRQWGSYYGGTDVDIVFSCTADIFNNIFISGGTTSNNNISTPLSHQLVYAGNADAFLAKLSDCYSTNAPGIITGTTNLCEGSSSSVYSISPVSGADYYTWSLPGGWSGTSTTNIVSAAPGTSGTMSVTASNSCAASLSSTLNINIIPSPSISVNSGSVCNGQSFTMTPLGALTYTFSNGSAIVSPTVNNTYSIIGTNGSGCISLIPAIITISVNPLPVISVSNGTICSGDSYTINTNGANTYTYSGGSAIVSPTSTTIYSVSGTSSNGCISAAPANLTLTVNSLPVISVNSGSICSGDSFTINASGANTYTYSSGSAIVSPTISTSYLVTGTSTAGCISAQAATSTVAVNALPLITVNSGAICTGQSFTIVPAGANSYTISGGSAIVNPTISTSYSVTGTNSLGCSNIVAAISSVSVNSLPAITISTSDTTICRNTTAATLTAFGAVTYTWSTGTTSNIETVMPMSTTNYTVTGTDANGCQNTSIITQMVDPCTGVKEIRNNINAVTIYPNPNNGYFTIELTESSQIIIYSTLGQVVFNEHMSELKKEISLSNFANGTYFVKIVNRTNVSAVKLIKN